MIANALAQGKTVLFVAEKMAALSVVQKRLNDIGLGSFCLELHSNKAKKKDVLEQLRQASEVVKGTGKEEYERKLDNINKIKEDLDKYAVELHKVRKSGFTFFEMINQYENYAECEDIKLEGLRDVTEIDRIEFEKMERNVERLIVAGRAIGHPCNHPLSVIGLREYSQSIKERLERYINTYLEALKGMQFAVLKFAGENSLKNPETYESLNLMVEKCVQYEIWYQYPAEWALQDKHSVFEDIEAMAQHFAAVIDTKEKLLTIWNEDFLKVPVSELLTRYNEAVSKWFLPKMLEINKLAKSLMLYSKGTVDRNHIGENLLLLKKYQDELNEANQLLSIYQQILGNLYQGDDTDWEDIANKAKKYKDPFSFVPSHTLVLYTNHLPKVGANDDGIWRRLVVIPFNAKITGKSDIKNYADYLFDHAGPAIMSWIIEGAKRAIDKNFHTTLPDVVEAAIHAYREDNDWLGQFLEECCEIDPSYKEKSGELYQAYRAHCMQNGEYIRSTTDFYSSMDKAGYNRIRKNTGVQVVGLKLKEGQDFLE